MVLAWADQKDRNKWQPLTGVNQKEIRETGEAVEVAARLPKKILTGQVTWAWSRAGQRMRVEGNPCSGRRRKRRGVSGCWTWSKVTEVPFQDWYQEKKGYHRRWSMCF